jgi:hypothetical protein
MGGKCMIVDDEGPGAFGKVSNIIAHIDAAMGMN